MGFFTLSRNSSIWFCANSLRIFFSCFVMRFGFDFIRSYFTFLTCLLNFSSCFTVGAVVGFTKSNCA